MKAELEMKISMVDLVEQYHTIKSEIDEAIQKILDTAYFIQGPEVKAFEDEVARFLGVNVAVGCASGTDALQIAMMAHNIGPDDEVITTPFTFVATVETITLLGAIPVYVDIDPQTYTIDPNQIEDAVTTKTKAIIPVHLYGQTADMGPIAEIAKRHNIKIFEDMAQAFGAKYRNKYAGTLSDVGCISFFPSKNLGAFGDAGMVVTNDLNIGEKLKMITIHGSQKKYNHQILGLNSRLDALQAAVLRVKLNYINKWNERRIQNAEYYRTLLKDTGVILPKVADYATHIFHQFSIRAERRDDLQKHLTEKGVPTAVYYPILLNRQEAFCNVGRNSSDLINSEKISKDIISLPMYPELSTKKIDYIVEQINDFYRV